MNIRFYPLMFKRDWPLIARELGCRWTEDTQGILAVDADRNYVCGACVLQNWSYSSVIAHLWIDKPMVLRHGFIEEIGRYVFDVSERELIIGMVPGDNEAALKLNKHIGFEETYRIKGGFMYDIDWVIMEGRRENFSRWLKKRQEAA